MSEREQMEFQMKKRNELKEKQERDRLDKANTPPPDPMSEYEKLRRQIQVSELNAPNNTPPPEISDRFS